VGYSIWVQPLSAINVFVVVFCFIAERRSGVIALEEIDDLIKLQDGEEFSRFIFLRLAIMSPCAHFGFGRLRKDFLSPGERSRIWAQSEEL
jgi:hypothetical protein